MSAVGDDGYIYSNHILSQDRIQTLSGRNNIRMQLFVVLFTVAAFTAQLASAYPFPRGRGVNGSKAPSTLKSSSPTPSVRSSSAPPALAHSTSATSQSIPKDRSTTRENDKKGLDASDDFNSPKVKTNPHLRTAGSETVSSGIANEGHSATFGNTYDFDVGGINEGSLKRANAVKKQKEGGHSKSNPFEDTEEIDVSGMNAGKKLNRKNAKKIIPQTQPPHFATNSPSATNTQQDAVIAASSNAGDDARFGSGGAIDGLVGGVGASALASHMESSSSSLTLTKKDADSQPGNDNSFPDPVQNNADI